MLEQIPLLAAAAALPTDEERPLLAALCSAAADEAVRRLRPGLTAEDCGDAFLCAAALMAAAGLISCRGCGDAGQFSVGDVSLRGGGGEEAGKAAAALRRQAAGLMEPYWTDGGFAFAGVKG